MDLHAPTLAPDYRLPFGRYAGEPFSSLLADPRYCGWLLRQEWVRRDHPALHGEVEAHLKRRRAETARLRTDFARTGER